MLDFAPFWSKTATIGQISANLTVAELRTLTNEMIDGMLAELADLSDADVTFVPADAQATDSEEGRGWPLTHIIVHTTASAEEAAFAAAEMARGVSREGRTRYETPWETVTTVAQCRQRLEESRRMRLATLDIWPDAPHLDVTVEFPWLGETLDARGRITLGFMHDSVHVKQIAEVARQAREARGA